MEMRGLPTQKAGRSDDRGWQMQQEQSRRIHSLVLEVLAEDGSDLRRENKVR